ncbi:SCO1664 family protein [Rhodococcus sp. HNM0569]|nr:SCO1664 family protein [Rhodococcus sp. HNM0569]
MVADPGRSANVDPLSEGDLTVIGQITTASNATLVCEAEAGDRSVRCVYKPVRGERPLWDFPDGTLAGREYAAYLVSESLGWGVVPRTLLRDGPFGVGMVQQWIDSTDRQTQPGGLDLVDVCAPESIPDRWFEVLEASDATGSPISLIHADDPRLLRMAVLDVVLNNADRKGGHVLEGLDGQVYGVDHGICLHVDDKLRTVLWGWAGETVPADLRVDISELVEALDSDLGGALAEHVTDDEITALQVRAVELAECGTMPLPTGSRRIPWPPF